MADRLPHRPSVAQCQFLLGSLSPPRTQARRLLSSATLQLSLRGRLNMTEDPNLPRRDFHQFTLAAMAGAIAGLAAHPASAQPVETLPRRKPTGRKAKPKDDSN